ncbi:site-specific integrase [Cryobacterium cheniae]|uniref:Site-specific integrase n=1 Tax=Cryobacterium cheniae TaxID=1259262 RepID=A0A4R8XS73_9MICO|nr:site-specific integrase [Cryobacterium cheniae]TFC81164.1 site-specific integrase [Cryobacterium cheniae]
MKVWINDRWNTVDGTKNAAWGKGSRWRAVWIDPTKAGKGETSKSFAKKADAEAYRAKMEDSLRAGTYRAPELANKNFAAAADAWFSGKKKPTGSSLKRYRDALDVWVLPKWGTRKLSTIEKTEIDEWVTALADGSAPHAEDRTVHGGGLSPNGITAVWVPFRAAVANALHLGWITGDPCVGVELPKTPHKEIDTLTHTEVKALADAAHKVADNRSDALMVELMAYAGLRPGEVVALQVKHVALTERRIQIRRTLTIDAAGKEIFGPPKHGERRDVPIAPHILDALVALTAGRAATAPLVTSTLGKSVNVHNWRSRVWTAAVAGSGLDGRGLTPKSLRHTAASRAIEAGADVKVIQRMLGHADATLTLNTYGHLWPDRLDEVAGAVSAAREKALSQESS